MKLNKDKKIKNPFPIFPILKSRNSLISLPNTPPKIEGDVKKPKNKEIQTIVRIPSEKLFLIENNVLSKTSDKPQLKNKRGIIKDRPPALGTGLICKLLLLGLSRKYFSKSLFPFFKITKEEDTPKKK